MTKKTSATDTTPHPLSCPLPVGELDSLWDRAAGFLISGEPLAGFERDRFNTARHEAAHVLASWAVGLYVSNVRIRRSKTSKRFPVGVMQPVGCGSDREEAFISCAGYVWETRHLGGCGGDADLAQAKALAGSTGLARLIDFTDGFIAYSEDLIDQVAVALYIWSGANGSGSVNAAKLQRLRCWAVERLPRYPARSPGTFGDGAQPPQMNAVRQALAALQFDPQDAARSGAVPSDPATQELLASLDALLTSG